MVVCFKTIRSVNSWKIFWDEVALQLTKGKWQNHDVHENDTDVLDEMGSLDSNIKNVKKKEEEKRRPGSTRKKGGACKAQKQKKKTQTLTTASKVMKNDKSTFQQDVELEPSAATQ